MFDILFFVQFFFAVVVGLYFLNLLKNQQCNKTAINRESKIELEKLNKIRSISLTQPLSEKTRPASFGEIEGQDDGIKALRAVLCGPNPQHVIIYGPPGVGKTAAARLILEEAKKSSISPFTWSAQFVEVDATTIRFDERGIADPLMGSVHDPIYQGAGAMGAGGIPQPKPGAVTKAHGGILFIDEIGELHPVLMNKLLKVLEDRKVFLQSAYYSAENKTIPLHIHEIFQNGLPADFRLVAATTRPPEELSAALRSRCIDIYFNPLMPCHIRKIVLNTCCKGGFYIEEEAVDLIVKYSGNGREAVNIVQIAGGVCETEGRKNIMLTDVEWVINCGHFSPRTDRKPIDVPQIGCVNGLAVFGVNSAFLIEIEVSTIPVEKREGTVIVTGIIDEEEIDTKTRRFKRKSSVKGSVDNVITLIRRCLGTDPRDYDIHINMPGGVPLDGPSAGAAITTAIYSALTGKAVDNLVAITGEVSIRGEVKPVGGVSTKLQAACQAGIKKVIIPDGNWQQSFVRFPLEIVRVKHIEEVINHAMVHTGKAGTDAPVFLPEYLSASPLE